MKKIRDSFDLIKANGQFGIEVEVEGEGLVPMVYSKECPWKTEQDGSLRGLFPDQCCEYVLAKPIPFGRVKPALEVLKANLDLAKRVKFSFRTSVHVHYNVQEFTHEQVMALIYAYTLLESSFMKFCGEERINNRFCLRVRDAEGIIPILTEAFSKDLNNLMDLDENRARYSALNVCSLRKYGSIEFRGMQGTADIERLMTWINAIHNLGEYAIQAGNPTTVYNEFVDSRTKKDFFKKVLPDVWESIYNGELDKEVDLSFSLSIDLPFAFAAAQKKVPAKPIGFPEQFVQMKAVEAIPQQPIRRRPARIDPIPQFVDDFEGAA